MDSHPFQPLQADLPNGAEAFSASRKVVGPAAGLIVDATLQLLYCGGFMVWVIVTDDGMLAPPAVRGAFIAGAALPLIAYVAMFYGAVQMLRCRRYGWAMAASILALLPCNALALVGIGLGIWGIAVLRRPDVRAAFRDEATPSARPSSFSHPQDIAPP